MMSRAYHYAAHKAWISRPGNRKKAREATARWKANNPESAERSRQKSRGLPTPDRPKPALCECCGQRAKLICIDHNHKTGHFRGWLCANCNRGIGFLGDSIEGLQRAMYYLVSIANDDLF